MVWGGEIIRWTNHCSLSLNSCWTAGPDKPSWLLMRAVQNNYMLHHWFSFSFFPPQNASESDKKNDYVPRKALCCVGRRSVLVWVIMCASLCTLPSCFKVITLMPPGIHFILWCGLLMHYKKFTKRITTVLLEKLQSLRLLKYLHFSHRKRPKEKLDHFKGVMLYFDSQ